MAYNIARATEREWRCESTVRKRGIVAYSYDVLDFGLAGSLGAVIYLFGISRFLYLTLIAKKFLNYHAQLTIRASYGSKRCFSRGSSAEEGL